MSRDRATGDGTGRRNAGAGRGDRDRVVVPLHGDTARSRARHPSGKQLDAPAVEAGVLRFDRSAEASSSAGHSTGGTPAGSGAVAAPTPARDTATAARPAPAVPAVWQRQAADLLGVLRRRLEGDYPVDEIGFDPELAHHVLLPLAGLLYDHWFRVEVHGIEHVPAEGGALLVANHAGGLWPLDAVMTAVAVRREHPAHRWLRPLGADLVFGLPAVGTLARRGGAARACPEDADRLLRGGELVGVWPEGFAGIGKPFRDRYRLQPFGRGGFVRAAIRAGVPIVPVAIVGAEEIHPVLGRSRLLARLLGLPYFPLTPTFPWLGPLGLVPLPSRWSLEFGEPVATDTLDASLADDPEVVADLSDRVRDTVQDALRRMLQQRRSPWR